MRHKPKKPYVVQSRIVRTRVSDDILDLFPDWGNWHRHGRYETEKQALQALSQFKKGLGQGWEFRLVKDE